MRSQIKGKNENLKYHQNNGEFAICIPLESSGLNSIQPKTQKWALSGGWSESSRSSLRPALRSNQMNSIRAIFLALYNCLTYPIILFTLGDKTELLEKQQLQKQPNKNNKKQLVEVNPTEEIWLYVDTDHFRQISKLHIFSLLNTELENQNINAMWGSHCKALKKQM